MAVALYRDGALMIDLLAWAGEKRKPRCQNPGPGPRRWRSSFNVPVFSVY